MPDTCELHIFSCARCRRQWTVHINDPDETTQCYFYGLCFDCIRETGVTQQQLERALWNAVRPITLEEQDRRLMLSGGTINGSHWGTDLMRLIAKSDPEHRAALRAAFPSYVEAYEQWMKEPAT